MQYVFLMGGWDGVSCNNDIAVYSPDGAPSGHMAPGARRMLSPRDALAAVTVEHDVLALGGHDGSNYLASCEIYTASTPGTGRFPGWTLLPAMETTRAFHGAAGFSRASLLVGGVARGCRRAVCARDARGGAGVGGFALRHVLEVLGGTLADRGGVGVEVRGSGGVGRLDRGFVFCSCGRAGGGRWSGGRRREP